MGLPLVLRIITRLNIGGPAKQALFLHGALLDRGFATELASGSEGSFEGNLGIGVEHNRLDALKRPFHPPSDLAAARAIRRLIQSKRPAVVHTHMAKAGALGRLAARRAGVPVVIHTFHGHVLKGYFRQPIQSGFIAIERFLAKKTDALIAVSSQIRDELLGLGIGTPSQWRVIPVGLELDRFMEDEIDGAEAKRDFGLPPDQPAVGIVGRLVPIKDHETFFRAASLVLRQKPDVTFIVAGDGELRKQLEAYAAPLLGGRIRFLGWVSDLPKLYSALDAVVLTSTNEGTPTALIEAGAAGKPVVATRVGGVPDVVRDGETGFVVRPRSPKLIAERILGLIVHPTNGQAMGDAARGWVADRFSAERLADDIAELYRELLRRRGVSITRR
jgi:glycosyltransferase involved in cell wall biosynthesis